MRVDDAGQSVLPYLVYTEPPLLVLPGAPGSPCAPGGPLSPAGPGTPISPSCPEITKEKQNKDGIS